MNAYTKFQIHSLSGFSKTVPLVEMADILWRQNW